MAYIGRSVDIGMFEKQVLTADSSTTTFTLTFAVGSANSLLVVYGGVIQEPGVAYSVSGGGQQIAFSEAPATGTTTYIIYLGKQLSTPRTAGQETTKQSLTGDGTTTLFTLTDPPVVPAGIMVFVDGILQREGAGNNYVSGGSTINFNGAPDSGAEIDVYTLVKEKVSIDTVADGSITRAKMASTFPYWNADGNFGVGASSLGTIRLNVRGDATTNTAGIRVSHPSNVSNGFELGNLSAVAANDVTLWNWENGYMRFGTNNTERVRIDSVGNVGIGTSGPAVRLHVASTETGYATTAAESISKATLLLKTHNSDSTVTSFGGLNAGHAYIQRTNGAGSSQYSLVLNPFGGDVGIGTIAPIASNTSGVAFVPGTTTVASMTGSNGSGQLFLGNNGGGSNVATNDTCGMIAFKARFNGTFGGGNDIASIIGTYTGDGTTRSGVIRFLTINSGSEAERMRVTSTGQLLIGKTTGTTRLDVQTSFDFQQTTFTSGAGNFGYIALPQTPSTTMMLVDLTNANNGNLNMSFILLVNTRNLSFGGGNGVTVVSSTQGSTGTGGEIGSYAFAITGTTTNLSLRATATLVSGSATIQFSARIIQI